MGLETRRVSETRKVTEKSKTAEELRREQLKETESLRRMVTELKELPKKSNSDIDQTWVRENESKEFSFSTPNQNKSNNQIVQDAFAKMDGVGAFGKNARGMSTKEFRELNESKPQTIVPQPEETISQAENISPQSVEISNKVEKTLPPTSEPPVQPPIIDPVSPTREEPQQQEPVVVDNTAQIEELSNIIDKKYNRLLSELSNLYNSEVINQEANVIRGDLQSLMIIKERSIEELTKVNDALNSLISRFAKLSQKADEIKTTDDFRINQQQKQINFLRDYQRQLESNYGKYWFGKMSEQEKEQYITLYTAAYKVPREVVEKQIKDSIAMAYNEIVSSTKQSATQQQETQQVQDETSKVQPEQQTFKGEYFNIIAFNIRTGVDELKQIYASLQTNATNEQIAEFRYLYDSLSKLSKYKPTNQEEEQQKLTQTYDITERIEQLQNSLSNTSAKSR